MTQSIGYNLKYLKHLLLLTEYNFIITNCFSFEQPDILDKTLLCILSFCELTTSLLMSNKH